jgi:glycosyltransferase involved in cell wall biosynthesis
MYNDQKSDFGIVELCSPNHSVLLDSWKNVFSNNKNSRLYTFVDEKTYARINDKTDVCKFSNNKFILFSQLISVLKRYDHIILNSVQTIFLLFAFALFFKKAKITLCVHNANAWQGNNHGPLIKRLVKRFFRYVIISRVDILAFCSQEVLDSFTSYPDKEKIVVPFQLSPHPMENTSRNVNDKINVVYPGIVSQKRKQYSDIIKAFKKLDSNYHLYLLGKANENEGGMEVLESCKNISNITIYTEFVPEDEFDSVMKICDFLISDLGDGTFKRYDYVEKYGTTKDSGVTHLVSKYHKPLILNAEFSKSFGDNLPIVSFINESDIRQILTNYKTENDYPEILKDSLLKVSTNTQATEIYEKIKHVYF